MPFREPCEDEPRCIAKTYRGERCRWVGVRYIGGGHVCTKHAGNYIPFFAPPDVLPDMMEVRRRAVLGLDD